MTTRAIIFDKDGTLFDFQATWGAWIGDMITHFAPTDQGENLAQILGYDLHRRRILPHSFVVAATVRETAQTIADFVGQPVDSVATYLNSSATMVVQKPVTNLRPCLLELREMGLHLAVMTNDGEHSAKTHLAQFGVDDLFTHVIGCDSGYGAKPDPTPIRAIADLMELPPEHCMMVGDSLHDLHAGRGAGTHCVGVLTGLADHAMLAPHADAVLPDITGLADLIKCF